MNIKRYKKQVNLKIYKVKCKEINQKDNLNEKNKVNKMNDMIKKNKVNEMNDMIKKNKVNEMNDMIKRPCSILESVDNSLKEIIEHKKGIKKLKSLEESMKLWSEWAENDDQ